MPISARYFKAVRCGHRTLQCLTIVRAKIPCNEKHLRSRTEKIKKELTRENG